MQTVLLGRGEPRSLPWTPASPAYDAAKNQHYTYDLDKAKSLVAASGESLSAPIDFVFLTTEPPVGSGALAQILQSDLAAIGVTINLRNIEFATLSDTMNNLKYTMAYDAVFRYGEFEPSTGMTTSSQYNYEKNFAGFKNDEYTRLITTSQVEADAGKRKDAVRAAERLSAGPVLFDAAGEQPADHRHHQQGARRGLEWPRPTHPRAAVAGLGPLDVKRNVSAFTDSPSTHVVKKVGWRMEGGVRGSTRELSADYLPSQIYRQHVVKNSC